MTDRMPPNAYEMEDVNPEQMALIEAWMEREAMENRVLNTKNLIDRYECDSCGHKLFAAAVAVGMTPPYVSCDGCEAGTMTSGCFEPRIQRRYYEGPVHLEFFRPLDKEECADAVATLRAAASLNVLDSGLAAFCPPNDPLALVLACQEAGVKSLMDGHLLPRLGPDADDE